MAFLCPVRIRRGKKKKPLNNDSVKELSGLSPGIGRITGSSSIETLVRVGIEKEHGLSPDSKMIVLHDFVPCVDDELEVKRGQIVNILYRENDWVYVIAQDSRQEGFIPHSYCAPHNSQAVEQVVKKKLLTDASISPVASDYPVDVNVNDTCEDIGEPVISLASLGSEPDSLTFNKDPSGRYIVLYTFIARDENDVSVERGEFVTVLNREDPDWFWIIRSDGQEGFIPSAFVYPADVVQGNASNEQQQQTSNESNDNATAQPVANTTNNEELKYHGTELVMLYDYKAQAPDDLSVRRGDWIYADLNNQTVEGWLWAYAPKTRKYGFIPKAYARPPAMTSL